MQHCMLLPLLVRRWLFWLWISCLSHEHADSPPLHRPMADTRDLRSLVDIVLLRNGGSKT
jgi:hypothetical protein